jgi:excisionase family DNA binding protein
MAWITMWEKRNETDRQQAATYKVAEAARVARVGTAAIRKGIHSGKIPHMRFGRNILIPKVAFHRWLNSCGA